MSRKTMYIPYFKNALLLKNANPYTWQAGVAADLQFIKNALSSKCNQVKRNETRYACIHARKEILFSLKNTFWDSLTFCDGISLNCELDRIFLS